MEYLVQALAPILEGLIDPVFGSLNASLNRAFLFIDGIIPLKVLLW
jgi:hypothetical protein